MTIDSPLFAHCSTELKYNMIQFIIYILICFQHVQLFFLLSYLTFIEDYFLYDRLREYDVLM